MKKIIFALIMLVTIALGFSHVILAAEGDKKPVEVVLMTPPFGTPMYNEGAAYEQVFQKANSWVHIKHQETPGAFYMFQYVPKNRDKILSGEISHTITFNATIALRYLAEGRPPFKAPWPTTRALVSSVGYAFNFLTLDPDIKTLEDLAGKRVGTATPARIMTGRLTDRPLFKKGLGIYARVKWAELGAVGSKAALLDNKLDAVKLWWAAKLEIDKEGNMYAPLVAPTPPTLEILSSGRKYHFLNIEPEWIKKGFDPAIDIEPVPGVVKKGAFKGIDRDIPSMLGPACIECDASLPYDVVEEIVRVRYEYRDEFAKHHKMLGLMPSTPYPIGTPDGFVHPGVVKAMKKLGIPLPASLSN